MPLLMSTPHLLSVILVLIVISLFGGVYLDTTSIGDSLSRIVKAVLIVSSVSAPALLTFCALWRSIPFLQKITFPYIGGTWEGTLEFISPEGKEKRNVSLNIRHTLVHIHLILETDESRSRTLLARVHRDSDLNCDRIFYVFNNERKEGVYNAGENYRGIAILRILDIEHLKLSGDYFTEKGNSGTVRFGLVRLTPWWQLWK